MSALRNEDTGRSPSGHGRAGSSNVPYDIERLRLEWVLQRLPASPQEQARVLDQILSASPDHIYVYDREGKYLYASLAGARALGLERSDIVGKSWRELGFPPEIMVPFEVQVREVFSTGQSVIGEAPFPTVEGTKSFEYVLTPLRGPDGSVQVMVCTVRDVTARKRAEDALRSSEALLRQFVRNIPALVVMFDRDMRVLIASDRWIAATHLGGQDIFGRSIYELLPDIPERWKEAHRRALTGVTERCDEDRWVRADGTGEWYSWELQPWRDLSGQVGGIILLAEDITERKQAEIALRESEARHRLIVDHSPDLLFQQDRDLRYRWIANPPPGLTKEQMLGRTAFDLVPREEAERLTQIRGRVLETGVSVRAEVRLTVAGVERYYDEFVEQWRDSQGRIVGILGYCRDITERKKAEAARLEIEARFRSIFDRAAISIAVVDKDRRVVESNPALQQMLGYSAEELRSMDFAQFTYPDDVAADVELYRQLMAGQRDFYRLEKRYVRKDGGVVWGCLTASAILSPADRPQFVIGMVEDITERKRGEEERAKLLGEVQRHAAELDATISSMAEAVWVCDTTGKVIQRNAAADRMTNWTPEQMKLPLEERLALLRIETPDGEPLPTAQMPILRVLRGEEVRNAIMVLHLPSGRTIWISNTAAPIRTPEGELIGAVSTATDVTKLHDLEEQRRQYILGISHGLRTPLTAIQGQAQLLLQTMDKAGLNNRMHRSTKVVISSAQRMSILLRDLVDLMNLGGGQALKLNLVPVDLRSFVLNLKERMVGLLEVERIRIEAPEGLPQVLADRDRLERILVNLLSNALKYSAPSTEVTVSLGRRDGEVVTSVTDRGPGIPPEELAVLFEPYHRLKLERGSRESVGLGLYITKGLVEALEGKMEVETEVGKGSCFSFTLPVV